ncbi:MAG TPA: SRPBCC domain-containing protein [Vicinamibacterales bacterium]|nr:SRPBCC domain-containing protein [Vicinamibacterales bacterium]
MITLAHRLDRTLLIHARPATVFTFFTSTPDWAAWWGAGSHIDPRPGGELLIRHPNGVEVTGRVLEVHAPERIVFTYGYASGRPIPPDGSQVTIRLEPHAEGTLLQLSHEFAEAAARDEHVQGWRFQLSLFANAIANKANRHVEGAVDRWFAAWSDPAAATRDAALSAIAAREVRFRDRFSCIAGDAELRAQLAAVHHFMPGMRLERRGDVRHCQWHVLADWVAVGSDGQERGRGTNVFVLDPDGRIADVTGFWAA